MGYGKVVFLVGNAEDYEKLRTIFEYRFTNDDTRFFCIVGKKDFKQVFRLMEYLANSLSSWDLSSFVSSLGYNSITRASLTTFSTKIICAESFSESPWSCGLSNFLI